MLFNSMGFLIFFPIVAFAYFLLPHRLRWILLLIASCVFYMGFYAPYILILFFVIGIDYSAGILMENSSAKRRRLFLIASIIANIGTLGIFKYFDFFNSNFASLAQNIGWAYSGHNLSLLLPLGLSFHTFQSLSYTIEVYRGRYPAERHLGYFALYVMFFPQLVAGPIERPQNLLPQLHLKHSADPERIVSGLQLMLWGFFKKLVIADGLGTVVDRVYAAPGAFSGSVLIVAMIAFFFQVYADFSAYSDIARGAARVLGINLMLNFRQPYLAKSLGEFWRRWHISLMTWFRDYVYIPLGGNRVSFARWQVNVFIVFLISGLWHGANWTFIIYGASQGIIIIFGNITAPLWRKLRHISSSKIWGVAANVTSTLVTLTLVIVTMVCFRANSLADTWLIVTRAAADLAQFPSQLQNATASVGLHGSLILAVLLLIAVDMAQEWYGSIRILVTRQPLVLRWAVYYGILVLIVRYGNFGTQPFIYFQF